MYSDGLWARNGTQTPPCDLDPWSLEDYPDLEGTASPFPLPLTVAVLRGCWLLVYVLRGRWTSQHSTGVGGKGDPPRYLIRRSFPVYIFRSPGPESSGFDTFKPLAYGR